MAEVETTHVLRAMHSPRASASGPYKDYLRLRHHISIVHLKRWIEGPGRRKIMDVLDGCEQTITKAAGHALSLDRRRQSRKSPTSDLVPRRTRPLVPQLDNTLPSVAQQVRRTKLKE